MTNEQLDMLVKDARLAAQCLQDVGSFEIGQAILREAADAITALRARAEAAETDAERLAEALDPAEIEKSGRRWHGEDHRIVAVRYEPYKPDGRRQMGVKGRWQEMVGSGDFWRWVNCARPKNLRTAHNERMKG